MCETQDALEAVTTAFLRSRLQSLPCLRRAAHSPQPSPCYRRSGAAPAKEAELSRQRANARPEERRSPSLVAKAAAGTTRPSAR